MEVVDGVILTEGGVSLQPGFNVLPVNVTNTICFGAGDISKLAPGNALLKRDPDVRPESCVSDQKGATLVGLSTGLSYVCRTCACNAERAICHRHGVTPPPVTASFDDVIGYFDGVRESLLDGFVAYRAEWQDAWIYKWPAVKQRLIKESLDNDAVLPGRVKLMVKFESGHAMPSRPRGIQYYPNLATQAAFGPEFYALQKAHTSWFQRRDVGRGVKVTFASGLNSAALGDWMREVLAETPEPHFYERDGKNWDATMQAEHLRVRLAAYACAGADFCGFVEEGFDVRGSHARGGLKYRLRGTVKSGHNDTTLGNSIVNASIAMKAMWAMNLRGDVIVAGDDLLVVVSGDFDEHAFAQLERECGIVPDYRKFSNPTEVSFISGVWFPVGEDWIFVPKPGRLLARLFWAVHPPPAKTRQNYLNSIVLGLRPSCGDMPIVSAFLDAHYEEAVAPCGPWAVGKYLKTWSVGKRAESQLLAEAMCARYGISMLDIDAAEVAIREARGRVGLLSHPVLDRILEVDLADLDVRPLASL